MRGKIKYVRRDEWKVEATEDHWSSDVHPIRHTRTYAVLYNGDEVDIDEDEIRDYYNRQRLTGNIIEELNNDLYNKWIVYDDDRKLVNDLDDII